MMPKLVDTRYRLNDTEIGSNTSTTSAPCDDETPVSLEHDEVAECQRTAAQKLGWNVMPQNTLIFSYTPVTTDVEAGLLNEGSKRIVETLNPFLLGHQAQNVSALILGLTTHYEAGGNLKELVVVVLVDSLRPLLHTAPPDLPHGVIHHVHLADGPIFSDLVAGNSSHTSANDSFSYVPWIGEDVVPGRPIFDLPYSMAAVVEKNKKSKAPKAHRSSIGLVLSLPPPPHSQCGPLCLAVESPSRQLYALTCGHCIIPDHSMPSQPLPNQRAQHLHHQETSFELRSAAKAEAQRQRGRIERLIRAKLQAARGDASSCKAIEDLRLRQEKQYVKPFEEAVAYHDAIIGNPHPDTQYSIGNIVMGENTVVIDNKVLHAQAHLPTSASTPTTSAALTQLPVISGSSSAPLIDPTSVMDWSLIELAPDVTAANTFAIGQSPPIYLQPTIAVARASETLSMYRNNVNRITGQYVGAVAYELRHRNIDFSFPKSEADAVPDSQQKWGVWVQHKHMVESSKSAPFALKGDAGNVVINDRLQPVGIISRAAVLPTNQSLTILCDMNSIFAHIEVSRSLPRNSIKILTKLDVA
ncbi:hypothetical protein ARMSODRAFT_1079952 [Armillaria solidipes]|uniref:Uncharacterized protein n=1 Tax=Armillaria solidipes TaxID=1076256 RepID=A0A2H3C936_9AGAR|nr:hypothetical protein ARMSODRAFT_1079952 [Armillaria solidipes]